MWGVLAFVTNFVPNIGFIIGLVPPAILGLLQGGWGLAVAVIVIYCAINFVIQSVLQPKFQGDALGLTTTLTFLALAFWTFVLGPIGAILALPMTMLVKAVFVDVDPEYAVARPAAVGRLCSRARAATGRVDGRVGGRTGWPVGARGTGRGLTAYADAPGADPARMTRSRPSGVGQWLQPLGRRRTRRSSEGGTWTC